MNSKYGSRIRAVQPVLAIREEIHPIETEVVAQLQRIPRIRSVVFDVYGTLVISGSGDVGSADATSHDSAMEEAFRRSGLTVDAAKVPGADALRDQIQRLNQQRQSDACPKPEVDIVEAWRRLLAPLELSWPDGEVETTIRLATTYEALANPTWPMPGAKDLLSRLKGAGMPLGIVSNAQVFTPPLVEDLLIEQDLSRGGFELDLCVFSNRFRQAKPGPRLFDVLREALGRSGILPHEAIYVGNDMLNDVWAASQAGLRTAWFAGDARSCRPRQDDARCRSLRPDVTLTNLMQLLECVEIK